MYVTPLINKQIMIVIRNRVTSFHLYQCLDTWLFNMYIWHVLYPCDNFLDIDECSSDPCMNGGSCFDLINGYRCTCDAGWTGTNCDTSKLKERCISGGKVWAKIPRYKMFRGALFWILFIGLHKFYWNGLSAKLALDLIYLWSTM